MSDDVLRAAGFHFAPQAAALVDLADGRLLACNRSFSVLLGFSEEELAGRALKMVVPDTAHKALTEALESTRTSPLLGHEAMLPVQREDGSSVKVRMRSRLVDDGRASPMQAVIAIDELGAPEHQDAFISMLAHELRNRLSNVRLAVQLLEREPLPDGDRWRWGLSVMHQQIEELGQLTEDLVDVSRLARGRLTLDRRPVDLSAMIREVVAQREDAGEQVPIRLSMDDDGPVIVLGDERRLRRVLWLLLLLAQTPAATCVDVRLSADDGRACLRVLADGIDAELIPDDLDVFRASARAPASRLGLGLEPLLVRGLVQRMDGDLNVRAGVFEVRLRRGRPSDDHEWPEPTTDGAEGHVLVVDDDRGAANTLALLLSSSGHAVEMAHDGEHGLKMAIAHRPKAALLDLKLPGMDGYALARRLRERFGRDLKLIALTGLDDPTDRARAKEAGFDHHLVKPLDVDELKSLLR